MINSISLRICGIIGDTKEVGIGKWPERLVIHMAGWEDIKGSLLAAGRDMSQKAKEVSEIAKLKMDIHSKEDFVEKQFADLGRVYYEATKENAVGDDIERFQVIEEALEEIKRMKQQVLDIQGALECPKCGRKVPQGTTFCSDCGTKINDMFEE